MAIIKYRTSNNKWDYATAVKYWNGTSWVDKSKNFEYYSGAANGWVSIDVNPVVWQPTLAWSYTTTNAAKPTGTLKAVDVGVYLTDGTIMVGYNGTDAYVERLNIYGSSVIWATNLAASANGTWHVGPVNTLAVDINGNTYIGVGGPTASSFGGTPGAGVVKLNLDGTVAWVKSIIVPSGTLVANPSIKKLFVNAAGTYVYAASNSGAVYKLSTTDGTIANTNTYYVGTKSNVYGIIPIYNGVRVLYNDRTADFDLNLTRTGESTSPNTAFTAINVDNMNLSSTSSSGTFYVGSTANASYPNAMLKSSGSNPLLSTITFGGTAYTNGTSVLWCESDGADGAYFGASDGTVRKYDGRNGTFEWTYNASSSVNRVLAPNTDYHAIFLACDDGSVKKLTLS